MHGAMSLTCQLCCAVSGHTLSTLPASAACSPNTCRAFPFSYGSRSGSRPEAGTASCNSILGSPRTGNPSQIFLQAHICLICRSCPLQESALIRITFLYHYASEYGSGFLLRCHCDFSQCRFHRSGQIHLAIPDNVL